MASTPVKRQREAGPTSPKPAGEHADTNSTGKAELTVRVQTPNEQTVRRSLTQRDSIASNASALRDGTGYVKCLACWMPSAPQQCKDIALHQTCWYCIYCKEGNSIQCKCDPHAPESADEAYVQVCVHLQQEVVLAFQHSPLMCPIGLWPFPSAGFM